MRYVIPPLLMIFFFTSCSLNTRDTEPTVDAKALVPILFAVSELQPVSVPGGIKICPDCVPPGSGKPGDPNLSKCASCNGTGRIVADTAPTVLPPATSQDMGLRNPSHIQLTPAVYTEPYRPYTPHKVGEPLYELPGKGVGIEPIIPAPAPTPTVSDHKGMAHSNMSKYTSHRRTQPVRRFFQRGGIFRRGIFRGGGCRS